jgi:uncharacterized membrane protein
MMKNNSSWNEGRLRSFLKAISWRVWATFTTMLISYAITGNLNYAISIGGIEVVSKILLFNFQERLWSNFTHIGIKRRQVA